MAERIAPAMAMLSPRSATAAALAAGLLATILGAAKAPAESVDLHRLFEERCQSCHGHAGDFAREHLSIVEGVLRGRTPDLRRFLERHHGPRTAAEADALYQMFFRQVEAGGRFKQRCGICHDSAADLARNRLIVVDGTLRGRYTGRDIHAFLLDHGRLDAKDAAFFYDALLQVALGRR
jgi:mono/diheme cytochrome c family protein